MDDGLLLFLQQPDDLLFAADIAADTFVGVIEIADNGGLFGERREGYPKYAKFLSSKMGNRSFIIEGIKPACRRNSTHHILQKIIATLVTRSNSVQCILDNVATYLLLQYPTAPAFSTFAYEEVS